MSSRIKILFVDDEERFLKTLGDRLTLRDFEVTSVTNAQDALNAATDHAFDLALVDLKMPGRSGDQLLASLKERYPDMEVIILTGHGSILSAETCAKLGAYRYLQKPCETDELLEVLQAAYRQRVQKKLKLDSEKMEAFLEASTGRSPLEILRRLRELSDKGGE